MTKNRRILVIDDNLSIHKDFKNILLSQDEKSNAKLSSLEDTLFGEKAQTTPAVKFEVDCAAQGQDGYKMAVDAFKAGRPYAMAFVDVRMPPGWDGIQTVEHIWAEYPDLQVVICTAYSDYPWDNIVEKLGHSDQLLILKKPFDTIEVMQLALALTDKWYLLSRSRAHIEEVEKEVVERTRELQEFAYGVSHDLQEPLRKVIAFGDRLREKCGEILGDDGQNYLNRMQDAAKRMSSLINDLLALSRVTTKAKPFVPVDLSTIVTEVLSDLEVRIEQVHGKVNVAKLPALDAEPTQMRQLFQNLIGNALKFRKKDVAPVIDIEVNQVPAPSSPTDEDQVPRWLITVRDNGIGFEDKYREKIFEVFQRLHGRGEYEGSGIGLSLCRKIVSRHGGTILAESIPGSGATFQITLPEKHHQKKENPIGAQAEVSPGHTETFTGPGSPGAAASNSKQAPSDVVAAAAGK